jgi:hypothetical protein
MHTKASRIICDLCACVDLQIAQCVHGVCALQSSSICSDLSPRVQIHHTHARTRLRKQVNIDKMSSSLIMLKLTNPKPSYKNLVLCPAPSTHWARDTIMITNVRKKSRRDQDHHALKGSGKIRWEMKTVFSPFPLYPPVRLTHHPSACHYALFAISFLFAKRRLAHSHPPPPIYFISP